MAARSAVGSSFGAYLLWAYGGPAEASVPSAQYCTLVKPGNELFSGPVTPAAASTNVTAVSASKRLAFAKAPVAGVFVSPPPAEILGSLASAGENTLAGALLFCPHSGALASGTCILCGTKCGAGNILLDSTSQQTLARFKNWAEKKGEVSASARPEFCSIDPRLYQRYKKQAESGAPITLATTTASGKSSLSSIVEKFTTSTDTLRPMVASHMAPPSRPHGVVARAPAPPTTASGAAAISVKVRHGFEVQLSHEMASQMQLEAKTRLHAVRKLILVLDLDHTLIHATNDWRMAAVAGHASYHKSVHTFTEGPFTYFLKVRPGVREFLQRMLSTFELHVDTAGSRPYAQRVVSILDPDKSLFGERIVSRCDSNLGHKQSAAWLHRSVDSMTIMVDDTEEVWRGARNLLLIEPYKFWKTDAEANNAAGASVTSALPGAGAPAGAKRSRAEFEPSVPSEPVPEDADALVARLCGEEQHDYLADVERMVSKVHTAYYSQFDAEKQTVPPTVTTSTLLRACTSEILQDTCFLFSGVFPLQTAPEHQLLYRRCLAFGAAISDALQPDMVRFDAGTVNPEVELGHKRVVTHLVARTGGTQKVHDALLAKDIKIVNLTWLHDCIKQYRRQEEAAYPLEKEEAACLVDNTPRVAAVARLRGVVQARLEAAENEITEETPAETNGEAESALVSSIAPEDTAEANSEGSQESEDWLTMGDFS